MKTILSMGAGVNSTAMLLLEYERVDTVLFADTGSEKPGTYKYIEKYLKPFCASKRIPFITVRRDTGHSKYALWPLHEYYEAKPRVPFRIGRETTVMWKLRPLHKWMKINANPCVCLIAIDITEPNRVRDSGYDWITNEYPLLTRRVSRSQCEEIIRKQHWPIPEKSGCWCCPFNTLESWADMKRRYPDLYARATKLELAAQQKWGRPFANFWNRLEGHKLTDLPQFHPSGSLIQLDSRFNTTTLDSLEIECSGSCFT